MPRAAKTAKTTTPTAPRLTALPPGYTFRRLGGRYIPARIITTPTRGALDASPSNPYYAELGRVEEPTAAVCASEAEALDVIATYLEEVNKPAPKGPPLEQDTLWQTTSPRASARTSQRTSQRTHRRAKGATR